VTVEIRGTQNPVNGATVLMWRCCENHPWIVPTSMEFSSNSPILQELVDHAVPVPLANHGGAPVETPARVTAVELGGDGGRVLFADQDHAVAYQRGNPGSATWTEPVVAGSDADFLVRMSSGGES
jgi:hypothetical protein